MWWLIGKVKSGGILVTDRHGTGAEVTAGEAHGTWSPILLIINRINSNSHLYHLLSNIRRLNAMKTLMYSEPFQDKSLLYVPIKGHLHIFSSCDVGYQGHVTSPQGDPALQQS